MKPARLKHDRSAGGKRSAITPEEDRALAEALREGQVPGFAEPPQDALSESADMPPHQGRRADLAAGVAALQDAVRTLPDQPGVYRMLDGSGEVLYVGKARHLKRRVAQYTQIAKQPRRLQRMVAETRALEVVTTQSEVEALLLESNLIKRFQPRFNVLLRDDKSFPYILLDRGHDFARISKHRGQPTREGDYFGPFASAGAVNRTVTALEKAFLLRSCSDAVFASRTRPCLMFQIKRCSAPCVGRIDRAGYEELVEEARAFLTGDSSDLQARLRNAMEQAAEALDFETAAAYRDRIRALAHIQSHQEINVAGLDSADVIAAAEEGGQVCIQVFFFRSGRNHGNRAYFPSHDKQQGAAEVLAAFVAQFYDNKPVPKLVLVSHALEEAALIAEALGERAGRKVELVWPLRGEKRKLMDRAVANARDALARRFAESASQRRLLEGLAERLGLDGPPERIEVYDNSHIQGSDPYGVMVVADSEGFRKGAYRKFKIRGSGGREGAARSDDDFAMMREVFERRFTRALKEDPDRGGEDWPDLVLIDGGRGQLNAARAVLAELGLEDLALVGVAKGPDRDAGRERIFLPGQDPILLPPRDPVLYFIQRLRDEAHRFAIGSHRLGRTKSRLKSQLDGIPGVGGKRKRALLLHFGSARAVARAGLEDLVAVEGISRSVAAKIYAHFHNT